MSVNTKPTGRTCWLDPNVATEMAASMSYSALVDSLAAELEKEIEFEQARSVRRERQRRWFDLIGFQLTRTLNNQTRTQQNSVAVSGAKH